MDEFGISTCLVGIGEAGESRLAEGFEDRESDAEMVPDSEIDADTRYVSTGEKVETAEFGSVDLVVVTGDVSDDDSVETAAHIGDSCDSDAVSVVLVASEPTKAELQTLTQSFGAVIVVERGRWIQELLTDLFTLYSQSMMLHTDYAQLTSSSA